MLRARGPDAPRTIALPDHDDFDGWTPPCHGARTPCVCTEKDAVKLWRTAARRAGRAAGLRRPSARRLLRRALLDREAIIGAMDPNFLNCWSAP